MSYQPPPQDGDFLNDQQYGNAAPAPTMDQLAQDDLIDFGTTTTQPVYGLADIDGDDDATQGQFNNGPPAVQQDAFVSNDNGFVQGGQGAGTAMNIAQPPQPPPPPEQAPPLMSSGAEASYNFGDSQSHAFYESQNLQDSQASFNSASTGGGGMRLVYADNGQPYEPAGGIVVYDDRGEPYYDEQGVPYIPQDAPIYDLEGHALVMESAQPPLGRVLYAESGLPYEPEGEIVYYDQNGYPYVDEQDVAFLPLDGEPIYDVNGNALFIEPVPPRVYYADNGEPYNPVGGVIVYDQNGNPYQDEMGNYYVPENREMLIFDLDGHALDAEFFPQPKGRYYPNDAGGDQFADDYDAFHDFDEADQYGDGYYDDEFYEDDPDGNFRSGSAGEGGTKRHARHRRRGFFRRGKKQDDEMAPIPGETPDERRERRKRIRRQRHEAAVKRAERRRRRRRWCWLCCCICCCLLLLLLLIAAITRFWEDDPEPEPELLDDDHNTFDDDFVPFKPYEGIRTTPMDPYDEHDCFFEDQVFPHMTQQCECTGNITIVPNDVVDLWYQVREDISDEFYKGEYDEPWWSCEASNQALVWLSSGNTRDSGDLYQRYNNAITFVQLNGTVWDMSNYWLSDNNECLWLGVQCNGRFQMNSLAVDTNNLQYVYRILVVGKNILSFSCSLFDFVFTVCSGSIPTEIYLMRGLRTLSITRNHLTGTIPTEIILMPKLEHLALYANMLRGSIPTEIGDAKRLKSLLLGNNLLFGKLVTEIGKVTTLEKLTLGFNEFWRTIPTELGLLTNLKMLVMEDNRFSGTLPTEISRLTNLEGWLISRNLLTGTIPTLYAALTKLQEFRIAYAGISDTFPKELAALTDLYRLELGGNKFKGTIMTEYGLMTSLSWLAMNDNDFSGTIPTEFGNLVNMTRFSVKDTLVNGTIPTELGFMTRLQDLALSQSGMTGRAPEEVCALRLLEMTLFVTDCHEPREDGSGRMKGVECSIPDCCTFCRRGDPRGVP